MVTLSNTGAGRDLQSTGFAWWSGNARLIKRALPAHQAKPVDSWSRPPPNEGLESVTTG